MKKSIFCMFIMLYTLISSPVFALVQTTVTFQSDKISYLDTVIVTGYEMNVIYADFPKERQATEEDEIGVEILVNFSNHLEYYYMALDDVIEKEMRIKGPDHVYNVRLGDVVVVRIVETEDSCRVVEFVANLSAR